MRCLVLLLLLAAAGSLVSCSPDLPGAVALAYKELPPNIDYNLQVKPILADKCFACHGPDKAKQKAGLRLDMPASAYGELPEDPGKFAVKPGNLKESELFHRIISADPEYMMPVPESHLSLSAREKAVLIKWIEDGAVYKPHWAFVKPVKAPFPAVKNEKWVINPIDRFIEARLEEEKLQPAKEADKETLLRRVSLDLTGLAPSLEETDRFLQDGSANAYEKQVDRLLASPQYGEKMAVDWLDLARFADSHGYTVDRLRDMSPYRDWVINAFNNNLPYSTFIQWQLAGDLMPNPTKDMIIATAFNRNHQQNMEGGVIEEEYQAEYVVDRTNTFGDAFIGLSVGCARCHDHKFDPVSQKNYYELFSFFNNVQEAGQISWNDAMPTPTLLLPTPEKEKVLAFIATQVSAAEKTMQQITDSAGPGFEKWLHTGAYRQLAKEAIPLNGLQALYTFDEGSLKNSRDGRQKVSMKRDGGQGDAAVFEGREKGQALVLNGDTWLDLGKTGIFSKSDPFSIGIRVNIPAKLKDGVLLHKSLAERLYNFRGYHLRLTDNKLELNMAHTAPSDAITRITKTPIPRDRWIQLTITYDGSSRAAGLRLYLDGIEMDLETTMDRLTKDILFESKKEEPGLQIGAWSRGSGFKDGGVDDIAVYNRTLTPFEAGILAGKNSWAALAGNQLPSEEQLVALRAYYVDAVDTRLQQQRTVLQQLRHHLSDSTEGVEELMVMREMPSPKKTFILQRGNYNMPGEQVFPNTPAAILPFSANLPRNRYGLAQWLLDNNHPLTARVAVNRFWQNFFGTGLVKTAEDFGNQGEMPSHPQLLDWLAVEFRESGWNIKRLNKLIVMSAAYRQDSKASRGLMETDPENRLLARGPTARLSAEMIRDNALQASGLLNKKIGGKSVKPYQPEGLWEINNTHYTPDSGKAVYRRSLYVIVKRSVPNPTLATFDAGSRSYCVARRQRTNTPLQALVTLNDPTFTEAMKVMGEQMLTETDKRSSIRTAYRQLAARTPTQRELELLLALQQTEEKKFREHPEKARGWLHAGQYVVDERLDTLQVAANAVVASTILNSDACLTKR